MRQESNVYEKLHIMPLERKLMFRDLKAYLVKETRNEHILKYMANETESCQPDMSIRTDSWLFLSSKTKANRQRTEVIAPFNRRSWGGMRDKPKNVCVGDYGFSCMKSVEIFLLPQDGILFNRSRLPKNIAQCSRLGLEPRRLHPETSALTMRPSRPLKIV